MGKFQKFKIQLAGLGEGVYERDFKIDTDFFRNMECNDVIDADVDVHMRLEHKHGTYYCHFELKGMMHIPCDRCLDPMEHPVDTTFDIAVKYGPEFDDSSDDVLIIPETDACLNVAYMLYDTMILTIPIRHVHPQGGCNKAMAGVLQRHRSARQDAEDGIEDPDPDELEAEIELPD